MAKSSDDLAKYGVAVKDASGELRSTYDILVDLKPAWDKMSSAEKVALGNTLAGVNQYKVFAAVMNQMDTAVEAYNDALNSSGSTMAQNEIYMQSLEAKTTALKAEFENLVLGKGGLQDFAKKSVDLGTSILKLVNDLGGLKVVLTALLALTIISKLSSIKTGFLTLITPITTLISNISFLTTTIFANNSALLSNSVAMQKMGVSAVAAEVAVSALTMAITAGILIWGKHQAQLAETEARLKQTRSEFISYRETLNTTIERIDSETTTKKSLIEINKKLNDSYDEEQAKLKSINELREDNINLTYEEAKAKAQNYTRKNKADYDEAENFLNNTLDKTRFATEATKNFTKQFRKFLDGDVRKTLSDLMDLKPEQALARLGNKIDYLGQRADEYRKKQEKGIELTKQEEQEYKKIEKQLQQYSEAYSILETEIDGANEAVQAFQDAEHLATITKEQFLNEIREENKERANERNQIELTKEEEEELIKKYNLSEKAINDKIAAINEEIDTETMGNATRSEAILMLAKEAETAQKAVEIYEELTKATSVLESEISSLATALTEQENNGSIALKTQLELIDAGYAAALAYDEETGACKLNAEAVQVLVEKKIREQIATLNSARTSLVEKLKAEAQAALTAAGSFLELAKAKAVANEASLKGAEGGRGRRGDDPSKSYSGWGGNGGYLKEVDESAIESNAEVQKLDTQIKALEGSLKQIKNVGVKAFGTIGKSAEKAAKSAGSGAKSTKDATKATTDATKEAEEAAKKAEEEKKKAIEETTQAIQEQINALDEEIAKIEKQTEAIQKQKQELENIQSQYEKVFSFITKQIDRRIQEIEKEKDEAVNASKAIVDAKKAEIEALEEEYELAIKAKEEEKDLALEQIESEIALLKENKEKREQYWDKEIDALKQKNKELKDSLELQEKLDALEKAKNTKVKVYKAGQGFVYDVDQTEIQKAQKELDEYLTEKEYEEELERLENLKKFEIDNYDDRIDELTKFKDQTQKSYEEQIANLKKNIEQIKAQYDQEIANLEANTKALEEEYDAQIAIYEGYKEQFTNMVNKYEEEQERLLASQLTGIDFENDNWMTRIDNLQNFVDEYTSRIHEIERLNEEEAELNAEKAKLAEEREALQRRLNEAKNGESSSSSSSSSNDIDIASPNYSSLVNGGNNSSNNDISYSGGGYGGSDYTPTTDSTLNISSSQTSQGQGVIGSRDLSQSTFNDNALNAARRRASAASQGIKNVESALEAARKRAGYASGIGKIKDDEIAVVGENPYQEIVLGSKVNNGQLMSLSAGSGVVNAESTTTLAGLLNMMGKFGASQFGQGRGTLNNNTNNDTLIINGVTIEGANIKDPQTFVNGLLSLKSEALQRAYKAH